MWNFRTVPAGKGHPADTAAGCSGGYLPSRFGETPDYGVMTALLEQMERGGADLVKLAVMPREASDVLELLRATSDFYEEH